MVQPGEDAGFVQVRLHVLGGRDAFRVRHLDRHRTVQVVVVGQIDPSEPTLTQTADDPVAPDPGGIAVRGLARTHEQGLGTFGFGQVLRLIHCPVLDHERSLMASGAIVASRAGMQKGAGFHARPRHVPGRRPGSTGAIATTNLPIGYANLIAQ